MKQHSDNLGAPTVYAPDIAYRRPDVYRAGHDLAPRKDIVPYQQYVFLGRYGIVEGESGYEVRARAKAQYGRRTQVFRTARWWVAYEVR